MGPFDQTVPIPAAADTSRPNISQLNLNEPYLLYRKIEMWASNKFPSNLLSASHHLVQTFEPKAGVSAIPSLIWPENSALECLRVLVHNLSSFITVIQLIVGLEQRSYLKMTKEINRNLHYILRQHNLCNTVNLYMFQRISSRDGNTAASTLTAIH